MSQINCIKSDSLIGCAPFKAKIESCASVLGTSTIYNYGELTNLTSLTSYEYKKSGLYSVRQIIAISPGVVKDSTFKNFFRVVSVPEINPKIFSCKNKSISIEIDSMSYDYFVIKNNLNSDTVRLEGFGKVAMNFSSSSSDSVQLEIVGKYYEAKCVSPKKTIKTVLVGSILPEEVVEINEYLSGYATIKPIQTIEYQLITSLNNSEKQSIKLINPDTLKFSISEQYDSIQLNAIDRCGNIDEILKVPQFISVTSFENNQNVITNSSTNFNPSSPEYLEIKGSIITKLSSNVDKDIVCGSEDCYTIKSMENTNGYTYSRIAQGQCGKSFSLNKPILTDFILDNSDSSKTKISFEANLDIKIVEINNNSIGDAINQFLELERTNNCLDVRVQNNCDQFSDYIKKCPLLLEDKGNLLSWNKNSNENYNIIWKNNQTDAVDIFLYNQNFDSPFFSTQYPAQDFCIWVQTPNATNVSNKICYRDVPFIFIPDLLYKRDNVTIKTKYIQSYTLSLYDLNGNLEQVFSQNAPLDIQNLENGTYFYKFEGISEKQEKVQIQSTILIKD